MSEDMSLPDVDETRCLGYGKCSDLAPEVFFVDDEGLSRVRDDADGQTVARNERSVTAAVDACPTEAISWARVSERD